MAVFLPFLDNRNRTLQTGGATAAPSLGVGPINPALQAGWQNFIQQQASQHQSTVPHPTNTQPSRPAGPLNPAIFGDDRQEQTDNNQQQRAQTAISNPIDEDYNPFGHPELDEMFHNTARALYEANRDQRQRDPYEDAWNLVKKYVDDVFGADDLNPDMDRTRDDPFTIGKRDLEKAVEEMKGVYASIGKNGQELAQMLEAGGRISPQQHKQNTEQAVISAAQKKKNADDPYYALMQLGQEARANGRLTNEQMGSAWENLQKVLDKNNPQDIATMQYYSQRLGNAQVMENLGNWAGEIYQQRQKENDAGWQSLNAQAAAYERLADALGNVRDNGGMAYGITNLDDAALLQQMSSSPKGKAIINRYMAGQMSGEDVARYGRTMAQALRDSWKPQEMTYEQADKYLGEQMPMYNLAKDTQGQMDDYTTAYGDIQGIGQRAARGETLTDTEKQAWSEATMEMPWLSDWRMNLDEQGNSRDEQLTMTPEQQRQLQTFGETRARQIADVAGLYSPYEMSPFNQGVWEQYVKTPEGAAQWAEEAQGTKDAQKAKDNLWFVERQSKYDDVASRPDFAETGKAKEDFHSGNNGFDNKYNVINNIGGAADRAAMRADIGGSSSYEVSLYNFMTPEEKGIFNSYANAGAIDAANEYLDYLSYAINERITKEGTERMRAMSESGVGGALVGSAVSVPLSLARGVGYLDQLGQNVAQIITGRPVDRNSQANMIGKVADSAREGVQNQVDWNVNILGQDVDVFDFLYGTAMSGIDSFTAGQLGAALGGIASSAEKAQKMASWTGAAILGGGAAQSAMQEAYDRGANDGTALLMGAIAGANETVWEHLSIGNLIKHGQDVGEKTFAEEIKNVLTEAGVNASEEFNTSVANGLAEYILNHDDREVQKKADEYHRLGLPMDEAMKKARDEFLASAVMDGVGGALMGGAFGGIENVQNRSYNNQVNKAAGRGFSPEAKQTLYSLAQGENASERARELAAKTPAEKASARQVGELFREVGEHMGAQLRETLKGVFNDDILLQIYEKSGKMEPEAADAITDMMAGRNLNGQQVAALAQSPAGMEIVDALFKAEGNEGDSSGSASRQNDSGVAPVEFEPMPGMDEAAAMRQQAGKATQIQPLAQAQTMDEAAAMRQQAGRATQIQPIAQATPEEQRAPRTPVRPPIRVKGKNAQFTIEHIRPDGTDVRIKTSGGQEISLDDADVDAGEAAVIQAAAGMQDQDAAAAMIAAWQKGPRLRGQDASAARKLGINPAAAQAAETETEAAEQGESIAQQGPTVLGQDASAARKLGINPAAQEEQDAELEQARAAAVRQAQDFAMGFQAAYEAARAGKTAENTQSIYADMLEPEARQAAQEAGRQAFEHDEAVADAANEQAARDNGYRTVGNAGADAVGVLFGRVREGIQKGGERIQTMLKLLDAFGKEYGMQVRVYDHLENDANGSYTQGTNIINLALDAEEGAVTKAASHEGYHFIRQFSPEMGEKIGQFVLDRLNQAVGYDLGERVRQVMQQYRDQAGQELSEEQAKEEIIADSMLDVIGTRENMEALTRESKSTAEKIKDWITNTYNKFKEILNRLAGKSPEVAALKDDVDYLGRISSMWQEGMRQAAEAWRQAQAGYNDSSAALEQSQAVQQYRQEMQGDMTVENRENSLTAFLSQLFMDTQKPWLQQHMDEYEDGLAKYREALLEYKRGGVALNVALERAGLSSLSGNDIRVASYAADQALTLEGAMERAAARQAETQQAPEQQEETEQQAETGGEERYSLPTQPRQQADAAAAVRQDAELYAQMRQDADSRAALELLMRMHEQTTKGGENALIKPGAFEKRLPEIVAKIKEETGTKMGDRTLRKGLRTVYQAMERPGYSVGEILTYAKEFYQQALEQAPGALVEMDDSTREAVNILRTNRFQLTPDQKSEIKGTYGSLGDFMRKNFGKMKISNSATVTLADVWRESLNPLNPGLFAEDTAEANMPGIIDAFLENAHAKKFAGEFGANIGAMSTDGALNMMLDFYDVPGAYKQKSEVRAEYQERFDNARALVNQYRQEARQAMNTARAEYQQKYRERLEKDRQTKAEREARQAVVKGIAKNTQYLYTRSMKGTDARHVPEELRGAIERLMATMQGQRAVFSGAEAREFASKYAKLAQDGQLHDVDLAARYDPDIQDKLDRLAEQVKETRLTDMSMEQLQDVQNIVDHLRFLVDQQNDIQANGRKQSARAWAEEVIDQARNKKEAGRGPVAEAARALKYKEMTPVYFAKQVGGTLGELMQEAIKGESDFARIEKGAKEKLDGLIDQYHVNDWLYDPQHLRMKTSAGDEIELTRQQAMTLYAWNEREKRNTVQGAEHLRRGGFVYDSSDADVKKMQGINFTKAHVLSDADMRRIGDWLTEDQRKFVAEMVGYLSKDMAEIGNKTSMALYGWKKFGEKWYFPYPTDSNFRGQDSSDQKSTGQRQIKNMGMSKALQEHAMNPLRLGNFTDLWKNHVMDMAMYGALAEKVDNLRRVKNYVVGGIENINIETGTGEVIAPISVTKELERALGREGVQYLEKWIDDVNGGLMVDERSGIGKMISLFKKGSVAANLSVMLQQPSAFVRAMSMVSPRYFASGLKEHGGFKATKERMYENSGTAILKQAGGFDTGTGRGSDWITENIKPASRTERIREGVDKATGKGAELADEITWVYMYSAIEHEIADKTGLEWGSEEFNRAVGERFDDVMRYTQVYDSIMAKSDIMRGKSDATKMVTSFMAEPTLWVNMLMDASQDVIDKKPGARGKAAKAVGVFVTGSFVNALLQSVATAFRRKKEEGTTWAEKYISEVADNFTDSIGLEGIAGMIPLARDLVSLFQGYDVERADMSLFSDIIDAGKKIVKKGPENATADDWLSLAGVAGNVFGVPMRNIIRDASGIIGNLFGGWSAPLAETSWRDILYTTLDTATPFATFEIWAGDNKSYYDRMEQALISGDMDKYNELRGYLEETKKVKGDTISTGIKAELKESVLLGLLTEEKAVDIMVNQLGVKDEKTAYNAIEEYVQKRQSEDTEFKYEKYADLHQAMESGQGIAEAMERMEGRGYDRKTLAGEVKDHAQELYNAGKITREQAEKLLKENAGITNDDNNNLYWTMQEWDWLKANPGKKHEDYTKEHGKYGDIEEAIASGDAKKIRNAVQNHLDHPHAGDMKSSIGGQITKAFKQQYIDLWNSGKKAEAANLKAWLLTAYEAAGYNRAQKNKDIDKWLK